MSWLRDHFYYFVYPAFMAAEKRTTEIGPPFHVEPSPYAPKRLPMELKKLWTLCQKHNVPWSYDVREINYAHGTSKYREAARLHHKILRACLDAAVTAMRVEGCSRLFLPGRDVWLMAVICARRGVPFIFSPEISRPVSESPLVKELLLERLGLKGDELLLDTGYVGSIPANLHKLVPDQRFPFRLISQTDRGSSSLTKFERRPNQLFPNRKNAREEAMQTEYLAKYWKRGMIQDGKIVQYLADRQTIQRAALLTSMAYRGIPFWKLPAKEEIHATYTPMLSNTVTLSTAAATNTTALIYGSPLAYNTINVINGFTGQVLMEAAVINAGSSAATMPSTTPPLLPPANKVA